MINGFSNFRGRVVVRKPSYFFVIAEVEDAFDYVLGVFFRVYCFGIHVPE